MKLLSTIWNWWVNVVFKDIMHHMKSVDIRKAWQEFWEWTNTPPERKHVWSDPASLIVKSSEDPTTLFNTAWMQPLVPYLMGKEHPSWSKRVYNIQGCVRTTDIDEVWDASHLTFFEMMGNWSLGDYFKKESVARSYDFLVNVLKLNPNKLCVSVFAWDKDAPRDEETVLLWQKQWIPLHKISYLWKSDNRRWPAGSTWPCGPDTEIFYRVWEEEFPPDSSNVWNDEENRMEIWNNVFMAYYKDKTWDFSELTEKHVDTWMWFERICMVVQHQAWIIQWPLKNASVYDTDIFKPILDYLSETELSLSAKRIIADHARTALQLVHEWLIPSNESRWYILRRIIRRMYFQWTQHWWTLEGIEEVLYHIKEHCNTLYDGTISNQTVLVLYDECKQFAKTLHAWEKLVNQMIEDRSWDWILSWADAFMLYDTYGFPLELTQELVAQAWWIINLEWFDKAMHDAQERSRAGSEQKFTQSTDWSALIEWLPPTEFIWYMDLEADNVVILRDTRVDGKRVVITNKTPFYAESWWQKADTWIIEMDDGAVIEVINVLNYWWVYLHFCKE